ncbi:MAG TPA: DUF420 domain-containing protein [Caldithrix abyssi]|uniref:DUF420 domain-containing protein n=1 Tax=Caldithrix abyssi TaxID=187145 RepID=A0A7V1LMA5_CALAY|nr:DUF420 domain-containing protein [Caldithrix abyssi]
MAVENLSSVNALLNTVSFFLLLYGYYLIKSQRKDAHKKVMISATAVSILFLISYLIYHYYVGSVPYPHHDWSRYLYFAILIPHVILAALNVPFIIILLFFAFKGRFEKHKKLAHWVWPIWLFVSISGVTIYGMLYHL